MRRARPALLRLIPTLVAWAALSAPASAQDAPKTPDPPPETAQFSRLAGDWEMTVWSREQTGEWGDPHTAYWSWRVIMGGHAVQDFWYGPGPEPDVWSHGTNVRIYDPESDEWRVRWTASDDRSFMELAGAMEPGDSLRLYTTHESGAAIRITFHDVTDDRFLWRLEAGGADGSWTLFSRMEGTRIPHGRRAGGRHEIRPLPGDDGDAPESSFSPQTPRSRVPILLVGNTLT